MSLPLAVCVRSNLGLGSSRLCSKLRRSFSVCVARDARAWKHHRCCAPIRTRLHHCAVGTIYTPVSEIASMIMLPLSNITRTWSMILLGYCVQFCNRMPTFITGQPWTFNNNMYCAIHVCILQSTEENDGAQGIVVGCYDNKDGYRLTGCGEGLDGQCSGQLSQLIDRLVFLSCVVIFSMCTVDAW